MSGRTTSTMRTTAPSPILYHPNDEKLCFFTKFIKNLMESKDTAKATTIPMIKYPISAPRSLLPSMINIRIFKALAPSITGIAKKKVNSAPAGLSMPIKSAPMMVAPERDVPGIKDNT